MSQETKEYLEDNNIQYITSPSASPEPEVNIIENVWFILKKEVYGKNRIYKIRTQLKDSIRRAWKLIKPLKNLHSLVDSLPRRLQSIIHSHGFYTKY